jgi:hypothetical protein
MRAGPEAEPRSRINAIDGDAFEPMLTPRTLKATAWGRREAGGRVEVDQMASYAARSLQSLIEMWLIIDTSSTYSNFRCSFPECF